MIALLLGSLLTFALVSALPASAADGGSGSPPIAPQFQTNGTTPTATRTASKLSGAIQAVADAAGPVEPGNAFTNSTPGDYDTTSAWFAAGLLRETSKGMLQVYIHIDGEINDGLRTALTALGTDIELGSDEQGIIQASVPYGILQTLANVEGVKRITEPSYGVSNVGANLTEGDAILSYDDLRTIQGVDGTGVTVGVISDGIAGLQTAVASGDLPATSEVRVGTKLTDTTGGVIATSFRSDNDLEGGLGSAPGAEGTAMLEIVHDIAPGAQLRFANFSTSVEFMAAVNFLASVSDVVVDDIGFFGRQTDGTSDVSINTANALTNTSNPIRSYVTAVGNGATRHYEGLFTAGPDGLSTTGFPGAMHSFVPASPTTDATNAGTQAYNSVRLSTGQSVIVWLVWEDTEGAPTADYDLFFQETTVGAIVGGSTTINAITGSPSEVAGITYSGLGTVDLRILVQNYSNASTARNFELMVFPGTTAYSNGTYLNYNTKVGSVGAQGDAGGGVLSVGAVNNGNTTTTAPYSSQGPTGDGRMKPDIVGVDGVDVSGAGGFPSPFFGTSAAAPHIAGLAALLLEFRPDLQAGDPGDDPTGDRSTLRASILNGSIDLGDPGLDNVYGAGRANGQNSATLLFATPVFDTPAPLAIAEGATRTVDGLTFTDLNPTDTHTIAVDWGDGGTTPSTPAQAQTNGVPEATIAVYDPTVFDIQSQGTIYTVNTTADTNGGTCDGTNCTLREAIHAANNNPGTDSIHFNIAGAGPHTIWVDSNLPIITEAVIIDGYTQTGASPNTKTLTEGLDTSIKIAVRPSISGAIGFDVRSSGSTAIRGLALQRFDKAISLTSGGAHVVEGNLLGTTDDGTAGLGNNYGVWVQSGATSATIGGSSTESANLIASSEVHALFVDHAANVTIQNNLIGRDIGNSTALATTGFGIYLWEGSGAVVTGNVIASSGSHGIAVQTWTTANISGNTISSNTRAAINNDESSTNINISGNTLAGNKFGVRIVDGSTGVAVLGNSVTNSSVLGIDIRIDANDVTDANDNLDADIGPNRMQNYPIITSSDGSSVGGTINTEASSIVRIELFTNAGCHSSGFGEGQTFVGVATVTADASGNATFAIPYATSAGDILTATATLALSTSHFSQCWPGPVAQESPYSVNTIDDLDDGTCTDHHCSLREAINAANNNSGTDSIHFNIAGSGPHEILIVGSALPPVTDPVIIDGYTQPGASPNTNPIGHGLNTVIKIAIKTELTGITGLNIQGGNTIVRGLAIERFNQGVAVTILGGNVIQGNFVGTTSDGTAALGNNIGVSVHAGAGNSLIGGTTAASVNLISGNEQDGIFLTQSAGTTIQNNLIGTDITGAAALGNAGFGIYLWEGSEAVVTGNEIASSGSHGIEVETWTTANISDNIITAGTRAAINTEEASTNINVSGNTLTGNQYGVRVSDSDGIVTVIGNSIHGNSTFGIDLHVSQPGSILPDINDPNDTLDADTGPNHLQNYPVITSSDGSSVGGTINTEASSTVRIELFTNSACHSSGFGEGQTFVGVATVTTDASGNATFAIPYSAAIGAILTSTATLALSTSHFSQCFTAPAPPHYADNGVFTATATVTDDEGLSDVVTFTVNVTNASPTADAGATLNVVEGATLTHVGAFTDQGSADTHTASVGWGDATSSGASVNQGAGTTSATRVYDDNGSFTLTLTITDDDGGTGTDTTTVTVLNATPVAGAGPTQIVRANTELTSILIATFTDDGVLDTHTSTIDWGDGTPAAPGALDQGARTVRGTHTYAVEGFYTVTATVTDNDGGASIPVTMLVIVQDAPIVDAGADVTIDEGAALLFSFSFIDSASETHDATVVWGDGNSDVATVNQSADTVSATHSYVEQGVFVLQASVSDDTGLSGLDSITVTVENVAPVVTPAAGLIATDLLVTTHELATFTDPGSADTHTAVIDWGDGTVEAGTISNGTVSGSHLLVRVGLHQITVTVTDDDGGVTEAVVNISVFNPPPVPTITAWGMALTLALMAIAFLVAIRQRSRPETRTG